MKKYLLGVLVAAMVVACSPIKSDLVQQPTQPVMEIAVRMVKDGQLDAFVAARRNLISVLKAQEGVMADREFQSFYALPQPDERDVYIGMTDYADARTVGKVQQKVSSQALGKFLDFKKTMDMKAYVFVQQTEGPQFDLETLAAGEGEILEVGIRRVKPGMEAEFEQYRREFVELLSSYNGVMDSYEFAVVGGNDPEGLSVGMTVYESKEAFMQLLEPIMQEEITQKYFSTFDVVASQFAFSTTNQ